MKKRADGRYVATATIEGKRCSFYGKTKAEADRKLRAAYAKGEQGVDFELVAEEWNDFHESQVSFNAHRAYRQPYQSAVNAFGGNPIKQITAEDVNIYIKRIAAQGYAKRTVQAYLSCISLIFDYGILHGYCKTNPCEVVPLPSRLKSGHRELPCDDDIARVKQFADAEFGFFPLFLLYTGLRRGEALALRMECVDLNRNIVLIESSLYWDGNKAVIKPPKTDAGRRTVPLPNALKSRLPAYKKGYVFSMNGDGEEPLTNSAFKRRWEKYVSISGIQSTCHQFRHLYATILYENDIDDKAAQTLLGHASIKTTRDIYTHIRESHMDIITDKINSAINNL